MRHGLCAQSRSQLPRARCCGELRACVQPRATPPPCAPECTHDVAAAAARAAQQPQCKIIATHRCYNAYVDAVAHRCQQHCMRIGSDRIRSDRIRSDRMALRSLRCGAAHRCSARVRCSGKRMPAAQRCAAPQLELERAARVEQPVRHPRCSGEWSNRTAKANRPRKADP